MTILVAVVFRLVKNEDPKNQETFNNLIHNITRVNNVLENLLRNYEQLQKIYKSKATFESASGELDTKIKNIDALRLGRTSTTMKQNNESFPGTSAFLNENVEPEEKTVSEEEEEAETDIQENDKNQKSNNKNKKLIDDNSVSIENGSSKSQEDGVEEKYETNVNKNKALEKETNLDFEESAELRIERAGTPKVNELEFKPLEINTDGLDFSVMSTTNQTKNTQQNEVQNDNKGKIQGLHGNDKEKQTIQDKMDITNETDVGYLKVSAEIQPIQDYGQEKVLSRRKRDASVIINGKDGHAVYDDKMKLKRVRRETDSTTEYLIKLCYKACKLVHVYICAREVCTKGKKEDFKSIAKDSCIHAFIPSTIYTIPLHRSHYDFIDATRTDIIIPRYQSSNIKRKTIGNDFKVAVSKPYEEDYNSLKALRFSVVRDIRLNASRYCSGACKYTIINTCKSHRCRKDKLRKYKKRCGKQCQMTYGVKSDEDSDATESSDDDDNYSSGYSM